MAKKVLGSKYVCVTRFWVKYFLGRRKIGSEKFVGQKLLGQKDIGLKKICEKTVRRIDDPSPQESSRVKIVLGCC